MSMSNVTFRQDGQPEPSTPDTVGTHSILTTHIKDYCSIWRDNTVLLPGWRSEYDRIQKGGPTSLCNDLRWGWALFVESKKHDAVITGWERAALIFVLLQSL